METRAAPFPTSSGESTVDALELSTASSRTAEDLVELVPGFETVQHGAEGKGHQFFVRGFDAVHGSDVEVRLEGIPLNEPSNIHGNGYLDLGFVIPETVASLQARKGSFDIVQGPFATAASLDFELGVPSWERGVRTLYEAGTTNRHRLAAIIAPETAARSTFAAVEAMHDDGFGTNRRSRRLTGLAQFRLLGDDDLHLTGLLAGYGADFGLPGTVRLEDVDSGSMDFYDAYVDQTSGASLRGIASIRLLADTDSGEWYVAMWGQRRQLELDENFTGFLQHPDRGDRRLQTEDSWTLGSLAKWSKRLGRTAEWTSILEWRSVWASQREIGLTTSGDRWTTLRSLDFTQQLGGAGAELDWSPLSWLRFAAGLRVDAVGLSARDRLQQQSGTDWFVVPSPRLKAAFYPGVDWTLYTAYGRGLRPPEARSVVPAPTFTDPENRDNTPYLGGEPRPTTTDHAELGARWTPSRDLTVDATVFGVWIRRESVFDHVSGVSVELNATRRFGLETSVSWRPVRWLDVDASLTAINGRFVASGRPIPGAPRLLGSTRFSMVHPDGWRGGLEARAIGVRPLGHGAEAAPAGLVDATAGYRWRWVQLDVLVENITGARWREGEYHYASAWPSAASASQIPVIHYVAGTPRVLRATLSAWF